MTLEEEWEDLGGREARLFDERQPEGDAMTDQTPPPSAEDIETLRAERDELAHRLLRTEAHLKAVEHLLQRLAGSAVMTP